MSDDLETFTLGSALPVDGAAARRSEAREIEPLSFSLDDYARRKGLVDAVAATHEVDALISWRFSTIDWLTAFHSVSYFQMAAIASSEGITLLVPPSEYGRALSSTASRIGVLGPDGTLGDQLVRFLSTYLGSRRRIGMDFGATGPCDAIEKLRAAGFLPIDIGEALEFARLRLSEEEQDHLRAAGRVTGLGYRQVLESARRGLRTDSELAGTILDGLIRNSNSLARGNVAVATGARGGITHATWNGSCLGESTYLEFAGASARYSAPVMRTLVSGRPGPDVARLADLAQRALSAVLARARPGVVAADVAREAKSEIGELDDDVVFHHNFGYPAGIGQITTWMDGAKFFIMEDNSAELAAGMAFHLPMSFRIWGRCAVGLSHTIIIAERGGPEIVTGDCGPAELTIIPE